MKKTVYVKLLDEDLEVWKPIVVEAVEGTNLYLVLGEPWNKLIPDEKWEFPPGAKVNLQLHTIEGKSELIATYCQ